METKSGIKEYMLVGGEDLHVSLHREVEIERELTHVKVVLADTRQFRDLSPPQHKH